MTLIEPEEDDYYALPAGKLATVVTYLEMRQRPRPKPTQPRPDLGLRLVERPDIGEYLILFRRIGEHLMWTSRLFMAEEKLRAILHDPLNEVRIVTMLGRDIGLLELDFRQPGECELTFFGLVPEVVGTGIGKWLMGQAHLLAWRPGIERFWLHTCDLDHASALPFYARQGFKAYKRAVEIFTDPRLTGHVPREAAPQVPLIEPASG